MNRRPFEIQDIYVDDKRLRGANMEKVAEIAKSISEIGLMNAPAVRIVDSMMIDGEEWGAVPVLIYGRHRLLAMQSLGREVIECEVYEVDDLCAELMEIDENLARAELSPAEEAAHIGRRQEIWKKLQSDGNRSIESKREDGRGHRPKEFASELSELTGDSKTQINVKIARARDLGSDINRIVGTSLDKGVEMDALAKLPTEQREELISRAERGEKVSARPAPEPKPITADKALEIIAEGAAKAVASNKDRKRQAFWDAWAALDETDRQEFAAIIWSQYKTAN